MIQHNTLLLNVSFLFWWFQGKCCIIIIHNWCQSWRMRQFPFKGPWVCILQIFSGLNFTCVILYFQIDQDKNVEQIMLPMIKSTTNFWFFFNYSLNDYVYLLVFTETTYQSFRWDGDVWWLNSDIFRCFYQGENCVWTKIGKIKSKILKYIFLFYTKYLIFLPVIVYNQ